MRVIAFFTGIVAISLINFGFNSPNSVRFGLLFLWLAIYWLIEYSKPNPPPK